MKLPTQRLVWKPSNLFSIRRQTELRNRKGKPVAWRKATPRENKWIETQPQIRIHGDFFFFIDTTDVNDELWLLIERAHSGWPEPPLYGFLVFDQAGDLITEGDFEVAPKVWTIPEQE